SQLSPPGGFLKPDLPGRAGSRSLTRPGRESTGTLRRNRSSDRFPPTSGPLGLALVQPDRRADLHPRPVVPGDRALDQQQAVLRVHPDHVQAADRHPLVAHLAGHPLALLELARVAAVGGVAADRARGAVLALDAVAGQLALEVV